MTWTEVGGVINLKKHLGEPFIGEYMQSEERPSNLDPTKTEFVHHLIGEDGAPFAVYGMSTLDRRLKQVRAGSKVRITFIGKEKTKDGKRDFNNVRVEVDTDKGDPLADPDLPF